MGIVGLALFEMVIQNRFSTFLNMKMKLISTDGPVDFKVSIFINPNGGVVFWCGKI